MAPDGGALKVGLRDQRDGKRCSELHLTEYLGGGAGHLGYKCASPIAAVLAIFGVIGKAGYQLFKVFRGMYLKASLGTLQALRLTICARLPTCSS